MAIADTCTQPHIHKYNTCKCYLSPCSVISDTVWEPWSCFFCQFNFNSFGRIPFSKSVCFCGAPVTGEVHLLLSLLLCDKCDNSALVCDKIRLFTVTESKNFAAIGFLHTWFFLFSFVGFLHISFAPSFICMIERYLSVALETRRELRRYLPSLGTYLRH